MDQFEKDYLEKVKKLSVYYTNQRPAIARSRIQMFAAALTRQLTDRKQSFDLILGAGNSGIYMMELVKPVYATLNQPLPPTMVIPLHRFEDDGKTENDNTNLIPYVTQTLKQFSSSRILFVDDEIMRGLTAKVSFALLLKAFPEIEHIDATIIAEHHFFEWHYAMPQVSLEFFAYSRLIQGLNGNIGYMIPDTLFRDISFHIPDVQSYNHAMALVVGGELKRKNTEGVGYFNPCTEALSKITNYQDQKEKILQEVKQLVVQGVEEYSQGKIAFRF